MRTNFPSFPLRHRSFALLAVVTLFFAGAACSSGGSSSGGSSGGSPSPRITFEAQTFSVPEDATTFSAIGALQVEWNGDTPLIFSSDDNTPFALDRNGALALVASLDYERGPKSYTLTATVRAEGAEAVSAEVSIDVEDVLEVISLTDQEFTVIESTAVDTPLGQLEVSVSDGSRPAFILPAEVPFAVDATGMIHLAAPLDHEATAEYAFVITASAPGAEDVQATVIVHVGDVDEEITFLAQAFAFSESAAAGSVIGQLEASVNTGDVIRFAAAEGLSAESLPFSVSEEGKITLREPVDYEEGPLSYPLSVTASVSGAEAVTREVVIEVENVFENLIALTGQDFTLSEAASTPQVLGTLAFEVPDGVKFNFTVSENELSENGPIEVDAAGTITLVAPLDHETAAEHRLTVALHATDAASVEAEIVLTVLNVLENRIVFSDQSLTFGEDTPANAVAATLVFQVPDASTLQFSVVEEAFFAGDRLFSVRNQGEIILLQALDYEAHPPTPYTLTITATAADAEAVTAEVVLHLLDRQFGDAAEPYKVETLASLQSIGSGFINAFVSTPLSVTASLAAHYQLVANIDASPTASGSWEFEDQGDEDAANDEHGFLPIGSCGDDGLCLPDDNAENGDETADNIPFSGTFDGNGFAISGLHIARAQTDGVGLFGHVGEGGALKRVVLTAAWVEGKDLVGGLAGYHRGTLLVDSSFAGSVQGNDQVGGLVGVLHSAALLRSHSRGSVRGNDRVGGLAGYLWGKTSRPALAYSHSTSAVHGNQVVGGLVGYSLLYTVSSSYATGVVRGRNAGGLVGFFSLGDVVDSFAAGHVSMGSNSNNPIGGIIGEGDGTLRRCLSTADVDSGESVGKGEAGKRGEAGALVGETRNYRQVSHCLASGSVKGGNKVGLVGINGTSASVHDVYALGGAFCNDDACVLGTLIGENEGSLRRAYYNTDAYPGVLPSAVGTSTGSDALEEGVQGVTENVLKGLICGGAGDAAPSFQNEDGDACSSTNAAAFPWDFGASSELPVINGVLGGVLDAEGQRVQIAFARRDRLVSGATDGVAKTISAPAPGADGLPSLPEGHTYHYVWSVRPGLFKAVSGAESATLTVTPLERQGAIRPLAFTIFEREAAGEVVGLYSDVVYLEVSEE